MRMQRIPNFRVLRFDVRWASFLTGNRLFNLPTTQLLLCLLDIFFLFSSVLKIKFNASHLAAQVLYRRPLFETGSCYIVPAVLALMSCLRLLGTGIPGWPNLNFSCFNYLVSRAGGHLESPREVLPSPDMPPVLCPMSSALR